MKPIVALAVAVLLALVVRTAAAQPEARTMFVLGSVGVAAQPLKDWNDDIHADERDLQGVGIPVDFKELGIGIPINAAFGYMYNDVVSVGAELGYQKAGRDNSYSDGTGSLSIDTDISVWSLLADATYWVPTMPGLTVSGQLGLGFGSAQRHESYSGFGNPLNDEIDGDWNGIAPIFDLGAAYFERVGEGPIFFGKVGYRYQNLGELDGDQSSQRTGITTSGPPLNNAGGPMDTDMSGVYIRAGVGWIVGKRY